MSDFMNEQTANYINRLERALQLADERISELCLLIKCYKCPFKDTCSDDVESWSDYFMQEARKDE